MNITKHDARTRALMNLAEAYHRIDDEDYEGAAVNLNAARICVDVLQRMDAGAVEVRIESITFGDGPAPFETTIPKRGEGE